MNNDYRHKIIFILSEKLPPFVESVNALLSYLKQDDDLDEKLLLKLTEVMVHSFETKDSIKEFFNEHLDETSDMDLKEENYLLEIKNKFLKALQQVNGGISMLMYLFAKERDLLDKLRGKPNFEKFLAEYKDISLENAINYLFYGAKKLVEIIDFITSEE